MRYTFEAVRNGFTIYVAHFDRYEVVYGALGTVMLFMLRAFVSANVLLAGCGPNATLARHRPA